MEKENYYGVRNDTFLAEMPTKAKVRKRVWKTEAERKQTLEDLIKASKKRGKLPEHSKQPEH